MAARHMSLSLGTRDIGYLEPGKWEMTISYRFLHSENIYVGSQERPQIKAAGLEPQINANSFDFSFRFGLAKRFSTTVTAPIIHSAASIVHPDGVRRDIGPGAKVADLRVVGTFWVFDPETHFDGNLSVGFGVKTPSANEASNGTFFTPSGPMERPVDISQQPGDGGWGIIFEGSWYQRAFKNTTAYAAGFYMFSPENTNGVVPPQSNNLADQFFMSVPDQYHARAGLNLPLWPDQGLAASLGVRVDGIPVTDAFGDSDGFRRPGYIVYIEPGVTFMKGKNAFNFWVPVAVARSIHTSTLDAQRGVLTGGGLADFLVLLGYTRRF